MPTGNGQDIFSGALSGYEASGSPWGALAGGVAAGLFGGKTNYGYSKGDIQSQYNNRQLQISQFSDQLKAYQDQYQQNYQNIATNTFKNFFGPNTMTQMAAMGFNPGGGATASALAREALPMQMAGYNNLFSAQQQDAGMVDSAYGQNSAAMLGGMQGNFGVPQSPPWMAGLGQLGGAVMGSQLQQSNWNNMMNTMNQGGQSPNMFNGNNNTGLFSGGSNNLGLASGLGGPQINGNMSNWQQQYQHGGQY